VEDNWIYKQDAADVTDIETLKGGISSAMKRTASIFGIGRYLYGLEEGWANFNSDGIYTAKIDGNWYKWNPPELPQWALPSDEKVDNVRSVTPTSFKKDVINVEVREQKVNDDFYRQSLLACLKSEGIPFEFVLNNIKEINWVDKSVQSLSDLPERKAQKLVEGMPKIKERWIQSHGVK
jgi:Rad52/22 family double-strand break repair protein